MPACAGVRWFDGVLRWLLLRVHHSTDHGSYPVKTKLFEAVTDYQLSGFRSISFIPAVLFTDIDAEHGIAIDRVDIMQTDRSNRFERIAFDYFNDK